ncbi:AsmA family protein [Massilia cavernae]|uniref:AsmA family protein n=1 Tax=Massilia cavernae TaxID=2320864 RepID=UPI00268334A0|nr:AsmA family protein [Massilia cavernae]
MANDVHLGNPNGMPGGDTASVRQFSFSLDPLALLDQRIAIPLLQFQAPVVHLQRNADGKNNWTFKKEDKRSPWELEIERVVFTEGVVFLKDAIKKADARADLETLDGDPTYGVGWKLSGTYNNAPVTGSGKAGAVLSLKQQTTPYPLKADFRMGSTRIAFEGTLTKPTQLAALDLQLKLSGASMARLYPLTGVLLPETPAFSTEGRLIGALGPESSRWTYDKFRGKVGSSDIGRHLEFQTGKPRGKLSGTVTSKKLQFDDLGPLIGADSNASKMRRGAPPVQPPNKVLPVEEFCTERWTAIDADVRYTAARIMREKQLPITKLSTHLILEDGVITLAPLSFGIAGGTLNSNIELDGRGRQGKDAIKATAKVTARGLRIKQLFPAIEGLQASVGQANGDASLSATGDSVATLLAASNGEVRTLINQGTVSKLLLEQMGLNLGNIVLTTLFGDKQVRINCMGTDFAVTRGLMQSRMFVIDTEEAVIRVDGTIDLANERLDLTIRPHTKGLRIFSLRAPLYVRGSFKQPGVSVDKGVLALKAGGALALATLAAPVAALLPLVHAGLGRDNECGRLLARARETGGAAAGQVQDPLKRARRMVRRSVRCRTDHAVGRHYSCLIDAGIVASQRNDVPVPH